MLGWDEEFCRMLAGRGLRVVRVRQPHEEAIPTLLTRPPADRERSAEFAVETWRVIGSPGSRRTRRQLEGGRGRASTVG